MDLAAYRAEAEEFYRALEREYVLHLSGRKETLDVEVVYDRHSKLFRRETVESLRDGGAPRELLRFGVEGLIGQATKAEQAELARLEATLSVEVGGERMGFRQTASAQANEADADRRAAIEDARLEVTERELNPLMLEAFEREAGLARELGWVDTAAMCEELSGIDLAALGRQAEAFLDASEPAYETVVGPVLEGELGIGFERLRRSDMAAFFRAPSLDAGFPAEGLIGSLDRTLLGMAIGRERVTVDAEERPTKSPRAFCAPVRVPDEVHLVIAPHGGRDDYEALFHEAGHALHFSHVRRELPFEQRCLGDSSVTEGYAFLLQHLVADAGWLREVLAIQEPAPVLSFLRASRLVFLRRYCAKLGYELELHGRPRSAAENATDHARRLSEAMHVDWPGETWLSDVDAFFYAARYLRAWSLETHLRALMRERFGERWFAEPEAGALLVSLWSEGQSRSADELLEDLTGERLDLSALVPDLALA
ncbi:MAG: hypothetical protein QOD53_338 [Thermoleophilaceae bacterium]|nr:hypothetical protein [Thermoleophilaceae bacterium]